VLKLELYQKSQQFETELFQDLPPEEQAEFLGLFGH